MITGERVLQNGNSARRLIVVDLLSIVKWKGFATQAIQHGVKKEKLAGCQNFSFLPSGVRRQEGGGKRPAELPVAKSLSRHL